MYLETHSYLDASAARVLDCGTVPRPEETRRESVDTEALRAIRSPVGNMHHTNGLQYFAADEPSFPGLTITPDQTDFFREAGLPAV